eukprot:758265-Hanusia_phi.AAC.7
MALVVAIKMEHRDSRAEGHPRQRPPVPGHVRPARCIRVDPADGSALRVHHSRGDDVEVEVCWVISPPQDDSGGAACTLEHVHGEIDRPVGLEQGDVDNCGGVAGSLKGHAGQDALDVMEGGGDDGEGGRESVDLERDRRLYPLPAQRVEDTLDVESSYHPSSHPLVAPVAPVRLLLRGARGSADSVHGHEESAGVKPLVPRPLVLDDVDELGRTGSVAEVDLDAHSPLERVGRVLGSVRVDEDHVRAREQAVELHDFGPVLDDKVVGVGGEELLESVGRVVPVQGDAGDQTSAVVPQQRPLGAGATTALAQAPPHVVRRRFLPIVRPPLHRLSPQPRHPLRKHVDVQIRRLIPPAQLRKRLACAGEEEGRKVEEAAPCPHACLLHHPQVSRGSDIQDVVSPKQEEAAEVPPSRVNPHLPAFQHHCLPIAHHRRPSPARTAHGACVSAAVGEVCSLRAQIALVEVVHAGPSRRVPPALILLAPPEQSSPARTAALNGRRAVGAGKVDSFGASARVEGVEEAGEALAVGPGLVVAAEVGHGDDRVVRRAEDGQVEEHALALRGGKPVLVQHEVGHQKLVSPPLLQRDSSVRIRVHSTGEAAVGCEGKVADRRVFETGSH